MVLPLRAAAPLALELRRLARARAAAQVSDCFRCHLPHVLLKFSGWWLGHLVGLHGRELRTAGHANAEVWLDTLPLKLTFLSCTVATTLRVRNALRSFCSLNMSHSAVRWHLPWNCADSDLHKHKSSWRYDWALRFARFAHSFV